MDPILTGRLHTNINTIVFSKPKTQFLQSFGKGREAGLFILCTFKGIRNADTGIDPGFVDIKSAAVIFKNFKRQ